MAKSVALFGLSALAAAEAKTYLKEDFNSASYSKKWVAGGDGWKTEAEMGTFERTKGEFGVDEGLQTSPKDQARFFALTAPLDSEFKNEGKDLVIAYTVKHEQNLQCGGAYIKLLKKGYNAKKFNGDTEYAVMFGPDLCGTSTRKSHVIFGYNGKNLLTKKNIKMESDRLAHRYTLIVRPDNTYEVQVDGTKADGGSLYDDFDFLLPKKIADPAASKPADWVDDAEIADPEDKKPEGYDDIPRTIPDPSKKQPEDWDEEEDGKWEAPQIANPDFKVWTQKKIPNPEYKGVWVHPQIDNPEFKDDPKVHAVCGGGGCSGVGIELWQVQAGSIFDDVIVTDSLAEAEAFAKETFEKKKDAEKTKYDAIEKAKADEAAKKAEEAKAAADAAKKDEKKEEKEDDEDEL